MTRTPRAYIAWIRIAIGLAAILVVGYSYLEGIARGDWNPFDFFGYFTNQTSLGTGVILLATGILSLRRRCSTPLTYARAVAVACMIIVAVIYNGIVPGTGSAPAWVSLALHVALPAYTAIDWLVVPDRPALPWRSIWLLLPYPLIWLAVVLTRGATDGWVPYGFLLPDHGPASLALHSAGLLLALLTAGALTWAASRVQLKHKHPEPQGPEKP